MSSASIRAEIAEVEKKIKECKQAKQNVTSVKSKVVSQISSWKQSYRRLNSELKAVKRTEVFEGELANALKDRVSDTDGKIKAGMGKAESLQSALSKQITNLERKIRELEEEKSRLKAALQKALAQEKEAAMRKEI